MDTLTEVAQRSWKIQSLDTMPVRHTALQTQEMDRHFCAMAGRRAVRSLYSELVLYPKPGLVSTVDNGSHDDMDAYTFLRSLFALRHYFVQVAIAGFENASFTTLKRLGIEAEQRMMKATSGINTHRGAIFCLGMLCAAVGRCRAQQLPPSPEVIRQTLLDRWRKALEEHTRDGLPQSHGQRVGAAYAVSGAREEAALGWPSVFDIALPAMVKALDSGRSERQARIDALFSLMAYLSDTNIYHRGGEAGMQTVKTLAYAFLERGGTARPDWEKAASQCHHIFMALKLSPGGAADLLAATCFVHQFTLDAAGGEDAAHCVK